MQVAYLGLADLGKTVTAEPGQMYQQVDICEENKKIQISHTDNKGILGTLTLKMSPTIQLTLCVGSFRSLSRTFSSNSSQSDLDLCLSYILSSILSPLSW